MAACENVVVTNCTMRTTCCGIRIGYEGDGPIRNCTFNNIVMHDTRTGIDFLVPRDVRLEPLTPNGATFNIQHGPPIDNIHFANVTMDTQIALNMWIGDDAHRPGGIRNVSFAHVKATTEQGCHISGSKSNAIEDIALNDVKLTMRDLRYPPLDDPMPYPFPAFGVWPHHGVPHAWFVRHVDGLTMTDVAVDWREATGGWRSAMRAEDCEELHLHRFVTRDLPADHDAPAIDCANVRQSTVRAARSDAARLLRQCDSSVKVID
jgi:hypothetical protein